MRFSKLRINGFKAFADPLELSINAGLNGVVGPNGCGKSNLVEAIGWVMGENRPTAMRSGAMEDVIFEGSATRPAGARAEVQLVIDNRDRTAPSGFNDDDQLVISRRLDRDLGSTFLANGRDTRWRDLQLLFADWSSGSRSSALVNQGQTNEIINSKPAARKGILEDAAGISGLHHRRHEAELKLSSTEQNLARVSDLTGQLASQIASLKRQAGQARRYRQLGEQLRSAEAKLLYAEWRNAAAAAVAMEDGRNRCTAETARLQRESRSAAGKRAEFEEQLEPLRSAAAGHVAALQRLRAEAELIESRESNARREVAALGEQIAELSEALSRETELHEDAGSRIHRLEERTVEIARDGAGFDADHSGLSARLNAARDRLTELELKLDVSNRKVADIRSAKEAAERARHDALDELGQSRQREVEAASAVADCEARLAEAAIAAKSAGGMQSDAERVAEDAVAKLLESETARSTALTELTEIRSRLAETDSRIAALTSEQAELRKLVRQDTADAVQSLNLVKVQNGYEAAFGAAFGDDVFAPVAEDRAASGWYALEPLEDAPELPAGVRPLSDFVQAPPQLQRRLRQCGLVSPRELVDLQPKLKPGQRIVTQDGDLRRWDGFSVSGSEAPKHAALRLSQLNRLRSLNLEISDAEQSAAESRRLRQELESIFEASDQADRDARESRKHAEDALSEANRVLSVAEVDASIAEKTLMSLREARSREARSAEAAEAAAMEAEQILSRLDDPEEVDLEAAGLKEALALARDQMLEIRASKTALEREQAERSGRLADTESELETWRSRRHQAEERIQALNERQSQKQSERPAIEALPGQLAERRHSLSAGIAEAEAKSSAATDRLRRAEAGAREAARAAIEADREAARSLELKGRADADAANAAEKLADAVCRIGEKTGCGPEELVERHGIDPDTLADVELLEIEVARLRRSRDALGAVNLMAEQNITELQSERDELERERADLEEAVARLRRTITSLNREGKERLLTAFEAVNANFSELFTKLFGGGKARLELVEGNDAFDTGLEILCHPPGKRFSTISLLSGGEQTLTAVALIFAFFLANPAPICVLDEVDAPLDDSNVTKFCELMKTIVDRTGTRFLVITHNPITMANMDRLYGITMQERGVSRLVSVDLGQAEKLAA
ncbi:MAG: chromosome segregation protein SMC [Rhodobacteraceae bacterium]|nr:chromosome segregation protein SMC [Paracoccaceae bacterium]